MYRYDGRLRASCPRRASSDRIRGDPHVALSLDIVRIDSMISASIGGRPCLPARDLRRQ